MCWNAEISLLTFISSFLMCCYLWYRNLQNDRTIALWILSFSLMQLFEVFMWLDINNKKGWNNIATKLSLPFILLQPFVLGLAILFYGNHYDNQYIKYFLYFITIITGLRALSAFIYILFDEQKWISKKGPNCHLIWYFIENMNKLPPLMNVNYFVIFYILLFLCMIPIKESLFYSIFGIVTYYSSMYLYGLEMGSMWCWIANLLGIYAILIKKI